MKGWQNKGESQGQKIKWFENGGGSIQKEVKRSVSGKPEYQNLRYIDIGIYNGCVRQGIFPSVFWKRFKSELPTTSPDFSKIFFISQYRPPDRKARVPERVGKKFSDNSWKSIRNNFHYIMAR